MFIKLSAGRKLGFTMAEFVVSMGVGLILMAGLVSFMLYTGFSLAGVVNYVDLEAQSQQTLDRMVEDVRQGSKLTDYATNKVVFTDASTNVISYTYDASARLLTRKVNGEVRTLLQECDGLNFSIYQRSPVSTNLYDLVPTTLAATNCKAISVRWNCSRKILGSKLQSETVQSTKIVLRN